MMYIVQYRHSWAQWKLSPLSLLNPLNILLAINGPVRYFFMDLTNLTINSCNFQKFNDQRFQRLKKI